MCYIEIYWNFWCVVVVNEHKTVLIGQKLIAPSELNLKASLCINFIRIDGKSFLALLIDRKIDIETALPSETAHTVCTRKLQNTSGKLAWREKQPRKTKSAKRRGSHFQR
jgi:hypothetical protein